MVGRTERITATDRARFEKLKGLKCIACEIGGWILPCGPTEIDHLLSGGKRIGHQATIPLGSWHHRAVTFEGWTAKEMKVSCGPSRRLESKRFHAEFGSDLELLHRTNLLIGEEHG